jgi:hypothetical protein
MEKMSSNDDGSVTITCCECKRSVTGKGMFAEFIEGGTTKPKELAKKLGWTHVPKGMWRCPECQRSYGDEQKLQ